MRRPESEASQPQIALPTAMLAWNATRFIANARARTQAGVELWVPADRLASALTQAAPAPTMPTMATARIDVEATSAVAAAHSTKPLFTTLFKDTRCKRRGT